MHTTFSPLPTRSRATRSQVFWDITYFVTGSVPPSPSPTPCTSPLIILISAPRFSSIIVSRFLLNLRQVGAAAADDPGADSHPSFVASHPSRLVFASAVIGNMGEQLELPYGRMGGRDADFDCDLDAGLGFDFDLDVSGAYGGSGEEGERGRGRDPSAASSSEGSEVHTPV